jgi:hypothetical protein
LLCFSLVFFSKKKHEINKMIKLYRSKNREIKYLVSKNSRSD